MKMKTLFAFALLAISVLSLTSCSKETTLEENQKNIKKLWKLDQYLVNGVDKTSSLVITGYTESYSDNLKYDRSFTSRNGDNITQNGSYKFESNSQVHVSGVGSIELTNGNTVSSSYYNIIRLTETQLWYSYTNGNDKHEFRLSRK